MGDIVDYIIEFGSFDFKERAFGAVDGLVLACFSYLNFEKKVPHMKDEMENVTLQDLAKLDNYEDLFANILDTRRNKELFEAMLQSKRFGKMQLNYYVNEHDEKEEKQFCALTVFLDHCVFLAFKGTDNTMIGWKEDFNMLYIPAVPSQKSAVEYLNHIAKLTDLQIYVGGHSKGGNLAVYCAANCEEKISDRIIAAYSYDGPGFKENIFSQQGYLRIVDRVKKYVPKSSIVGLLLQQEENYFIVDSNQVGILQHDPFSWIIKNGDFVYIDNLDENADYIDKALSYWLNNISDGQRKIVIDVLYNVFQNIISQL